MVCFKNVLCSALEKKGDESSTNSNTNNLSTTYKKCQKPAEFVDYEASKDFDKSIVRQCSSHFKKGCETISQQMLNIKIFEKSKEIESDPTLIKAYQENKMKTKKCENKIANSDGNKVEFNLERICTIEDYKVPDIDIQNRIVEKTFENKEEANKNKKSSI